MRRPAMYNTDEPGKVIKEKRREIGMTQSELALAIRVRPSMVARMELENHGLDSVQTRRDLAKALGISPLLLGVGNYSDTQVKTVYNTNILRTALSMHREAYFTTGNFGIPAINSMVAEIGNLLKENDNAKEILEVYVEYNILGIDIGGEEMNLSDTTQYIDNALDAIRSLNNRVLLADTLMAASVAMHELDNLAGAEKYALQALQIKKLPNTLRGAILTDSGLATGDMGLINQGLVLARKENDYSALKLTPDYCFIRKAFVLVAAGKYNEALQMLDIAQGIVPKNLVRRQCYIQTLQARCFAETKEYDQAELLIETALPMAQEIKSIPSVVRLRRINSTLKTKR